MELSVKKNKANENKKKNKLYTKLDRGIKDMEAGRELPLEESFEKISELRNARRDEDPTNLTQI